MLSAIYEQIVIAVAVNARTAVNYSSHSSGSAMIYDIVAKLFG